MRLLLHTGTNKLHKELLAKAPDRLGWLVTPASGKRKVPSDLYLCADNGCFQRPPCPVDFPRFVEFYALAKWVVLPDVVGNALKTRENSLLWRDRLENMGLKRHWAYVLQDGFDPSHLPRGVTCLFLGGSDDFKLSQEALRILKWGREQGYQTHAGRVNSRKRLAHFMGHADSADGSNFTAWVCNPSTRRILRRFALQETLF